MEDWIEIEGTNKREAIERACNALNTNATHLKYEVIEEGKRGTRIRARKVDDAPAEAAPAGGQENGNRGGESAALDGEDETYEPGGEEEFEDAPYPKVRKEAREPREEQERTEHQEPAQPWDPAVATKAREQLETILKFIEPEAEVSMSETDEEVYLDMKGSEAGRFIGKHGQTLTALQYLISRMSGMDRMRAKRLVVDSEQYLERRRESLESLADKLAARARREGRPIGAQPMGATDRRILHMALQDHPHVTTKSVGEGLDRRVLIVPRRSRNGGSGGSRYGRRGGSGQGQGQGQGRGRNSRGRYQQDDFGGNRRGRSGPPPRMHDSFDAPPEPEDALFEDPDAPEIGSEADPFETPPRREPAE